MVKVVDNYVLERQIGKGQFGEVYKSYNKVTGEDIAVKTINRASLKGKFYELLENEIKVLRSCNNINIIKLHDIKKTKNNIYLMLEYCNEGDLMGYLKEKTRLTEEEAIDFFIQILNAFKTLVKNKIMHRDFKLANILKHNGTIKIADFGFAKLLGSENLASTTLGSPLNMAPEVLQGKSYNNKADIWSVGTCLYELLVGKPPYTAKNIQELISNINTKPLKFPKGISISPVVEEVIRQMLVVDPNKRIDWEDLFCHPVNHFLEDKIMKEFEQTMGGKEDNLKASMFYVKNNKVIDHVADIEKKQEINEYTYDLTKHATGAKVGDFKGNLVKRQQERSEEQMTEKLTENDATKNETLMEDDADLNNKVETEREVQIKVFKTNSSRLLHERNKYVFLASVAEDAISLSLITKMNFSEMVGFVLIKKLFFMIGELKEILEKKKNIFKLDLWDQYAVSKDFHKIYVYISKEYDVFRVYYDSMHENVRKNCTKADMNTEFVQRALMIDSKDGLEEIYQETLFKYAKQVNDGMNVKSIPTDTQRLIHLNQVIDCLNLETTFTFKMKDDKQFNFKLFYEELANLPPEQLKEMASSKLSYFK
jgi:serine/threonine-protein kinase ULK/ATG1